MLVINNNITENEAGGSPFPCLNDFIGFLVKLLANPSHMKAKVKTWFCRISKRIVQKVFLEKCVLKICSKFTGEHPCRSAISIKLLCNRASTWVFSCKFAAYFQNTFYLEHLWVAASDSYFSTYQYEVSIPQKVFFLSQFLYRLSKCMCGIT